MRILTPDQRLRVFVSSTLQELGPERAAACAAIEGLQLTPVLFEIGARPHPPQDLYRAYLEQSQVFVGIYWQSYGWTAPGDEISGIEDEYRLSAGLPRLLYVKEPAPSRDSTLETLLHAFQSDASASYKQFETAVELGELVARDLAVLITERFTRDEETPAPAEPHVPVPRTSFVGRTGELGELESLFAREDVRLVTLTGPGGIGKTRLAVELARRRQHLHPEETVFVPLENIAEAELVVPTIGAALGLREADVTTVADRLDRRAALLVLDNFEHVMAAAPLVAELLDSAPSLRVLATSRELLRLTGEHELQVPPLSAEDEAVTLFVERASAAQRLFDLSTEDASIVAEICRRLDGVPLAIELAAPRLRLLTPEQLLDRLRDRLSLTGTRDAPARQQTLESAIAWSFELLRPLEQALLLRLGVFRGSFTIEAAQSVSGLPPDTDVVELLASLLDKSMVYRVPGRAARFAMLSMIRDFAFDRLRAGAELDAASEALAQFYVEAAREIETGFRSTAQRDWKAYVDAEIDSLRFALDWLVDRRRGDEAVMLLRAIWMWTWLVGQTRELLESVERVRLHAPPTEPNAQAWIACVHGFALFFKVDIAAAAVHLEEARTGFDETNDPLGMSLVKIAQGLLTGPLEGEAEAQMRLARLLTELEELGDAWGVATTLHAMTRLRTIFDDYDDAEELFARSLAASEAMGDELMLAMTLTNTLYFYVARGEKEEARAVAARVLELLQATGIRHPLPDLLEACALLEADSGAPDRAAELAAAAAAARETSGLPMWGPAVARYERLLERLRSTLGDAAFDEAWQRGRRLRLDDITIDSTASAAESTGDR